MRSRRGDAHSLPVRQTHDLGPHFPDVAAHVADVLADAGADLDDRLVHLGLDPLFERELPLSEQLLEVRAKLPCLRIDDLELFPDAESERGPFAHRRTRAWAGWQANAGAPRRPPRRGMQPGAPRALA